MTLTSSLWFLAAAVWFFGAIFNDMRRAPLNFALGSMCICVGTLYLQ